jgi:hypothetical protein
VLQRAVGEGLAGLLDDAEAKGGLPAFILREVRGFVGCGDLRRGFVRVKCDECGEETRVGFSCKARNLCPSCTAKRAALTAVHLVDEVLPAVPWRQWTLAFPRGLKLALAIDASLLSAALNVLVRAVFAWQRRRAKALGVDGPRPGAVAFVQYFSGALLLHPHFHVLVPDGVFQPGNQDGFAAVPPPDDEDVEKLLLKVAKKVWALARARYPDGLPYAEDAKTALSAASVQTRLVLDDSKSAPRSGRRCAFLEGFSLHADTHLHQNDRLSLERLCRYGARGPLAQDRLSRRDDGKLEYRLSKPLPGGATTLVLTPVQLLKRLVAVMAKPRIHLTRFFGVFAPAASARAQVVPGRHEGAPPQATPASPATPAAQLPLDLAPNPLPPLPPRLDWAALLRRTWGFDVFDCPCGGRRRVLAFVTSPKVARDILGPPSPRPRLQPTGPPQLSLGL